MARRQRPTAKPPEITRDDWESVDVPEARDEEFATAKPFKEVFPAMYEKWRRGARRSKS
jgi:hypothetical protein